MGIRIFVRMYSLSNSTHVARGEPATRFRCKMSLLPANAHQNKRFQENVSITHQMQKRRQLLRTYISRLLFIGISCILLHSVNIADTIILD